MRRERSTILFTISVLILLVLLWQLVDVLLLIVAACIVSVGLSSLAKALSSRLNLAQHKALIIVVVVILLLLVAALTIFGRQLASQFTVVIERLPNAWADLRALTADTIARPFIEQAEQSAGGGRIAGGLMKAGGAFLGGLANIMLVLIAGVFIAWDPALYRRGLHALVPVKWRSDMNTVLDTVAHAWALWLGASLVSMLIVATLIFIGTSLIGLPGPLALGMIAGILEFVPIIGSFAGAVPTTLFALTANGNAVWWTILLFVCVQQLESSIVSPLLMQRIVNLPPAMVLFAIVTGGALFGLAGVFLAVPLAILTYVLIVTFYVRRTLGEDAALPGQH